jgi:hypothetical protein
MYQILIFMCVFAGITLGGNFNTANYQNSYVLTPMDYTVYWNVDLAANTLHLALKVKTTGWVCFFYIILHVPLFLTIN